MWLREKRGLLPIFLYFGHVRAGFQGAGGRGGEEGKLVRERRYGGSNGCPK